MSNYLLANFGGLVLGCIRNKQASKPMYDVTPLHVRLIYSPISAIFSCGLDVASQLDALPARSANTETKRNLFSVLVTLAACAQHRRKQKLKMNLG